MLDAELFSHASQLWSLGAGKLAERNWTDQSLWAKLKSYWPKIGHLSKLWAVWKRRVKNLPVGIRIGVLEKICKSWEIWPHQWKNEQRLVQTKTTYCAFNPAWPVTWCNRVQGNLVWPCTCSNSLEIFIWSKTSKWTNGGKIDPHGVKNVRTKPHLGTSLEI